MFTSPAKRWADDDDGAVFRLLAANGFDFSKKVDIDFNIDFDDWPPPPVLLETLRGQFANIEMFAPTPTESGYVLVVVNALLTYELVIFMQNSLTELAASVNGVCESWGVFK
jgi:hypothetical protein